MHTFLNLFLYWDCSNFFLFVGVWTVGNIGREEGTIHWALFGAYATFPLYWFLEDDSTWYLMMTLVSALAFDTKSKKWRRKPKQQKSLLK
jgi:DnaJ family protein C protein 22